MQHKNNSSFFLSKSDAHKFILIMGVVCYLLAIADLINGPKENFTGRWAWLMQIMIENYGLYGQTILFAISGTILIGIYFVKK